LCDICLTGGVDEFGNVGYKNDLSLLTGGSTEVVINSVLVEPGLVVLWPVCES